MLEDKLLIWKFKGGSSEALSRIYCKYGDYLLDLAAALLQDVNTAEDVVHDVFCKFIESREKLKLAGSLWLSRLDGIKLAGNFFADFTKLRPNLTDVGVTINCAGVDIYGLAID
jgi:hypothetical protein